MDRSHNQKVPIHDLLHHDSFLANHSPRYTNRSAYTVDYESRNENMRYDQGLGASNSDDMLYWTNHPELLNGTMAEDYFPACNLE